MDKKLEEMEEHMDEVSEYRSFNIRYNNTDPNRKYHKAFIEFCWAETDGNYLQGIKKLLESHSLDYKYNLLYKEILELKARISMGVPEEQEVEEEDEGEKVF